MNISDDVRSIAYMIWEYYFDKSANNDMTSIDEDYAKANKAVRELGISHIDFEGQLLTITLSRPGLLIGAKGANLDGLTKYLESKKHSPIKIKIIEDGLPGCLYHYPLYLDDDEF